MRYCDQPASRVGSLASLLYIVEYHMTDMLLKYASCEVEVGWGELLGRESAEASGSKCMMNI